MASTDPDTRERERRERVSLRSWRFWLLHILQRPHSTREILMLQRNTDHYLSLEKGSDCVHTESTPSPIFFLWSFAVRRGENMHEII